MSETAAPEPSQGPRRSPRVTTPSPATANREAAAAEQVRRNAREADFWKEGVLNIQARRLADKLEADRAAEAARAALAAAEANLARVQAELKRLREAGAADE